MGMEVRNKRRPGGWTQADWRRCHSAAVEEVGRRTEEGMEQATCRGEGGGDLECGGGDLNFKLCINGPVIILIRKLFL